MSLTRSFSTACVRDYFRSGWAFLIPYLAAYLLYAWLKWPVNIVAAGSMEQGARSWVPCLLHIYWLFHALHLLLGAIALRGWWRESGATVTRVTDDNYNTADHATSSLPSTVSLSGNRHLSGMDRLWPALPWLCLAAIFWIPGVYLEWPSDPWHHLQRINWWHDMDFVTAHSSWLKSSYFIPYSLLSWATGLRQIFWLDFYYTGICLLLCWQYFLLARACGLGRRTSMVFVLLQTLLFGNNIFSFYRYYGISSSIYAQLGAVALTRLAIEAARGSLLRQGYGAQGMEKGVKENGEQPLSSLSPPPRSLLLQGASALALLALTSFNHVQGLGIAGLGVGAVIVWSLIQWRRSMFRWLAAVATLLSVATVLWYPRHADIAAIYQSQGWLNGWYGFNLFDPSSIAFDRSLHILGAFGLLNLATALWLIRRNHIAGWLTLMPIIALALPCVALPFAQFIASTTHTTYIVTFHRMLFAIPNGLALVTTLSLLVNRTSTQHFSIPLFPLINSPQFFYDSVNAPVSLPRGGAFLIIPMALGAALIIPPRTPNYISPLGYNRSWNALAVVPADLRQESAEGQTSPISQAAYLSQHWAPHRNTPILPKVP